MIKFRYHSGIYTLETEQRLPISLAEAWAFFSSPENLCKMTPAHMKFEISSGRPDSMYKGQMITYKLSPLPGIKTNWVTEITESVPPSFFVDEQRFGPYLMWHHEHFFQQETDGILMKDKVSYKLPFGLLGHLAHSFFVKRQLKQIFEFRTKTLESLFISATR
ncbi:SRPBCC family protein [Mangrovibacterium lignilyticum]|uniref:SRPBCC family protein n=1 Tax=Mangrovibacterium lignilyticum TaxID=2668052 RepID=UPI0013D3082B|nr:SRPBCC family protein [Mangrovibacterium lignilyticum]